MDSYFSVSSKVSGKLSESRKISQTESLVVFFIDYFGYAFEGCRRMASSLANVHLSASKCLNLCCHILQLQGVGDQNLLSKTFNCQS